MSVEPRPAKRDAAADGFSFAKNGGGRGVENGMGGVSGLPMDEMSSVQGKGCGAMVSFDFEGGVIFGEVDALNFRWQGLGHGGVLATLTGTGNILAKICGKT